MKKTAIEVYHGICLASSNPEKIHLRYSIMVIQIYPSQVPSCPPTNPSIALYLRFQLPCLRNRPRSTFRSLAGLRLDNSGVKSLVIRKPPIPLLSVLEEGAVPVDDVIPSTTDTVATPPGCIRDGKLVRRKRDDDRTSWSLAAAICTERASPSLHVKILITYSLTLVNPIHKN